MEENRNQSRIARNREEYGGRYRIINKASQSGDAGSTDRVFDNTLKSPATAAIRNDRRGSAGVFLNKGLLVIYGKNLYIAEKA